MASLPNERGPRETTRAAALVCVTAARHNDNITRIHSHRLARRYRQKPANWGRWGYEPGAWAPAVPLRAPCCRTEQDRRAPALRLADSLEDGTVARQKDASDRRARPEEMLKNAVQTNEDWHEICRLGINWSGAESARVDDGDFDDGSCISVLRASLRRSIHSPLPNPPSARRWWAWPAWPDRRQREEVARGNKEVRASEQDQYVNRRKENAGGEDEVRGGKILGSCEVLRSEGCPAQGRGQEQRSNRPGPWPLGEWRRCQDGQQERAEAGC
jgi:hypothetical protein